MNQKMTCNRLSAIIPRKTCIARQKRSVSAGEPQISLMPRLGVDPGCVTCEQGAEVAAELGVKIKRPTRQTHKNCIDCGKRLPLESFPRCDIGTNLSGRQSACLKCHRARVRRNAIEKQVRRADHAA